MEQFNLEHVPGSYTAHAGLFRNVKNASFLREQLLARNTDFEYAFIDARVVLSRLQLLSAVFKAVTQVVSGALKTPNVHSETVLSLSNSKNIAEAYSRYGISPDTTDLIVVKITTADSSTENHATTPAEQVWQHVKQNVEGDVLPLTDENLAATADMAKIRRYYKLNGLEWLHGIKDDELRKKETEMLVMSAMALRGV